MNKKEASLFFLVTFGAILIIGAKWYGQYYPENLFGYFLFAFYISLIAIPICLVLWGFKSLVSKSTRNKEAKENQRQRSKLGKITHIIYIVLSVLITIFVVSGIISAYLAYNSYN